MGKHKANAGRVIATRVYRHGAGATVTATVYEPEMVKADEWKCDFRISGLPQEIAAHASGLDSMQALMMSFEGVRAHLESAGEALIWADGEPGDFGIPRPMPFGFGLEVEKHLTKMVRDEVTRLVEAKRASQGEPPREES